MGGPATEALAREVQRLTALLNQPAPDLPPEFARWYRDLGRPDFRIRAQAARELGASSDPRATEFLLMLLKDPHPEVRREAVPSLAAFAGAGAVPALAKALQDDDALVPTLVVEALANLGEPALPTLLQAFSEGSSDRVRHAVARALARVSGEQVERAFIAALSDFDPEIRRLSAAAFRDRRSAAAVLPLGSLLSDIPYVAEVAHSALEEIGEAALPALVAALDRGEPDLVRRALLATRVIARMAPAEALFPVWVRVRSMPRTLRGEARRLCAEVLNLLEERFPGADLPLPADERRGSRLPIPAEHRLDPADLPRPSEA